MKKLLITMLAVALLASTNAHAQRWPLTDADPHAWYADSVEFVMVEGIMNGKSETTFDPYGMITRGMVATILHRMAGAPAPQYGGWFDDVFAGSWYSDAVRWAGQNAIVTGSDNEHGTWFSPGLAITREQFAAMLFRYAAFQGLDTSLPLDMGLVRFRDRDHVSPWAFEALHWAVFHGIITGSDNMLEPGGTATRVQAAVMLHRFSAWIETQGATNPHPTPTVPPTTPIPTIPPTTLTPTPTPPITVQPNASEFELTILSLTNAARAEYGLAPLTWHNGLAAAAREHSIDMWQRNFYAHICPSGRAPVDRIRAHGIPSSIIGENILIITQTPEDTFDGWMRSPGHRANILNPRFTHVGVGHFFFDTGGCNHSNHNYAGCDHFWTQKFAL